MSDNASFGTGVVYYIVVSDEKKDYIGDEISYIIKQSYRQLAFDNGANEQHHELGIYYRSLKKAEQELMPPQPLPDGTTEPNPWAIVPDFNTKPDSTAPQITANTPIPWIPQVNNPDGNNGWM